MALKRRTKVNESFSMASMTDVIFLLLIFFMVTSTVVIPNAIKVTLPQAKKQIDRLTSLGFDRLPVCIAKTQYSFSDDPAKTGAPTGFTVTVKNVKISAGAGFVVVLTGDIMTMPGLPKSPAAERIDVTSDGKITGLF